MTGAGRLLLLLKDVGEGTTSGGGGSAHRVPTPNELVRTNRGRLLTVKEAGWACVKHLIETTLESHGSTTLLLTTFGAGWWSLKGNPGRKRGLGKDVHSCL